MGLLEVEITDLAGNVLAQPDDYVNLEADIPINDSRTGKVTFDISSDAAEGLASGSLRGGCLDRMVKIRYRDNLPLWGYVLRPTWDAQQGTVECALHDPTLKVKHHFHRRGDFAVRDGYSLDGFGVRLLLSSAWPNPRALAEGVPGPGILWGLDDTLGWHYEGAGGAATVVQGKGVGKPPSFELATDGANVWRRVERGTNVWESLTNLMAEMIGFDVEFTPVDADHEVTFQIAVGAPGGPYPVESLAWTPGNYCKVDTHQRQGIDRARGNASGNREVVFHHGFGADTCENVIYDPDGDAVRNHFIANYPGGDRTSGDVSRTRESSVLASMQRYGVYQGWESSGQRDSPQILKAKSDLWVAAYGYPPEFFQVELRAERGPSSGGGGVGPSVTDAAPPRLYDDFWVGDVVTAYVKKGHLQKRLDGRVTRAKISRASAKAPVVTEVEAIPTVVAAATELGSESG